MIRTMFAVASVAAVVLGVGVAVAQQDVIKERKAIMNVSANAAKRTSKSGLGIAT